MIYAPDNEEMDYLYLGWPLSVLHHMALVSPGSSLSKSLAYFLDETQWKVVSVS